MDFALQPVIAAHITRRERELHIELASAMYATLEQEFIYCQGIK